MKAPLAATLPLLVLAACVTASECSAAPAWYETRAADGVQVYGYPYLGDLPDTAPVILLFHQGGSSARGASTLVAERVGTPVDETRARLAAWLAALAQSG